MKNLAQMMKQAQEMQGKMTEMQEALANTEVTGTSGGGMVSVVMTGKGELRGVTIDPSLMTADEKEVLEDLIVAACNDARTRVDAFMAEETQKMMGGMQLPPGFKMPF